MKKVYLSLHSMRGPGILTVNGYRNPYGLFTVIQERTIFLNGFPSLLKTA